MSTRQCSHLHFSLSLSSAFSACCHACTEEHMDGASICGHNSKTIACTFSCVVVKQQKKVCCAIECVTGKLIITGNNCLIWTQNEMNFENCYSFFFCTQMRLHIDSYRITNSFSKIDTCCCHCSRHSFHHPSSIITALFCLAAGTALSISFLFFSIGRDGHKRARHHH